jgi:hypothetical protein
MPVGSGHGFLLSQGTFTPIDFPGGFFTSAQGINSRGELVGVYVDTADGHGYLLRRGTFTSIDFHGATFTFALNISAEGGRRWGLREY